jgi:hypothetical protein
MHVVRRSFPYYRTVVKYKGGSIIVARDTTELRSPLTGQANDWRFANKNKVALLLDLAPPEIYTLAGSASSDPPRSSHPTKNQYCNSTRFLAKRHDAKVQAYCGYAFYRN